MTNFYAKYLSVACALTACSFMNIRPALAQDEACSGSCPDGEKTVAHADGDKTSCYCTTTSSGMAATVPDTTLVTTGPDAGQGENTGPSNVVPGTADAPDPNIS
jgi:hypothetical protein